MLNQGSPGVRPGLLALALFGLAGASAVEGADKQVDLTVVSGEAGYKLEFLNSECAGRPDEKGCIEADHGNSPVLKWELDRASGADWMLTRLQFSPDGDHWGEAGHPLQDCTMEAFALETGDRDTGIASTAMVTANGRKLQIRDRNQAPCSTHYRLYAMPRAGGAEIDSDPVIDNRGGGNR